MRDGRDDRDWDDDYYSCRREEVTRPATKGVASFVMALVAVPVLVGTLGLTVVLEASSPGTVKDDSPEMSLLGLVFMVCGGAGLIGLALSIRALIEPTSMKIFAVMGTIGNAMLLLGMAVLVVAGIVLG